MAVNKVEYAGNTLIDLTADTVTAETLMQGVTAHGANGEPITGTLVPVADPTLQSKTVTPSASVQSVTADAGYDGLDTVTVNAIPGEYVKPAATKGATTYTPKTTAQTIAAGTYCSGAQTIAGDANLVAANIVSGKTIFGVAGSAAAGAKIKTGNFTLSEKAWSYSIAHGLQGTPNLIGIIKFDDLYVGPLGSTGSTSATLYNFFKSGSTTKYFVKKAQRTTSGNSVSLITDASSITISANSADVTISGTSSTSVFRGLYGTYSYIIGVV